MVTLLPTPLDERIVNYEKKVTEYLKCQKSYLYFLQNHVYIQDRTKLKTLKWEPWPYLIWLAKLFLQERLLVIGKARQLGISWLVASYAYWIAKFSENAKCLMLSQGEDAKLYDLKAKASTMTSSRRSAATPANDNTVPDFVAPSFASPY